MSASEYVKGQGLKNLQMVSHMTGVRRETLNNWYKDKFRLFEIVVEGCVATITRMIWHTGAVNSTQQRSWEMTSCQHDDGRRFTYVIELNEWGYFTIDKTTGELMSDEDLARKFSTLLEAQSFCDNIEREWLKDWG